MMTRPDFLLRLEGLLVLAASLCGYSTLHGRWWIFAAFFLLPDISLIGYIGGNKRFAAALYNAIHSYTGPLILGLIAWKLNSAAIGQVAAIWIAHIGFDRVLGFGLKFPQAFKPTHIQNARMFRE